ncbi:winged helix DNA-binding domain-containing protein [soil metagenome]
MPASPRRDLTALRLAAQRIAHSDFARPADVVRHMLAMQAQDFPGAKWSVGLRLPGSTDAAIEAALATGEIVRSWPMRGTLHFVAAEDLGWLLDIAGPRQATWAAKRRGDLEITEAQLGRAADLAVGALSGGRVLRRDLLLKVWEEGGIPTTGQRAYHLLWNLGHAKVLVFGPVEGKQPTFTLLEEWVPNPRRLDRDEALAEFATRYFSSHGPATVRDFAWWASITLGDARQGVAAATGLVALDVEGTTYYLAEGLEPGASGVHALPGFDEYLLGYQDRSAALAPEHSQQIVPGNNGMFLPTIVVDGEVVGTWKRTEGVKKIIVDVIPFTTLTKKAGAGFARDMKRYGEFTGKPVELRGTA